MFFFFFLNTHKKKCERYLVNKLITFRINRMKKIKFNILQRASENKWNLTLFFLVLQTLINIKSSQKVNLFDIQ